MSNSKKLAEDIRKHRGLYDKAVSDDDYRINYIGVDFASTIEVAMDVKLNTTPNLAALVVAMQSIIDNERSMIRDMFIGKSDIVDIYKPIPLSFDPTIRPSKVSFDDFRGFPDFKEIPLGKPEPCTLNTIKFKEFGPKRTDDFNINEEFSNKAFLIDDGTVTIVSNKQGCSHTNKRKEGIRKLFWVCNDCKKDLGDV